MGAIFVDRDRLVGSVWCDVWSSNIELYDLNGLICIGCDQRI